MMLKLLRIHNSVRSKAVNYGSISSTVEVLSSSKLLGSRCLSNTPSIQKEAGIDLNAINISCRSYSQPLTVSPSLNEESLLKKSPNEFLDVLNEHNIRRCFVVYDADKKKVVTSHEELQELGDFFAEDDIDFREHEGVFMAVGPRSHCLLGAFVWRTSRGQACGGIRLWRYPHMERYLRDGLRLAYGMGVKSALAGLWAGGGKGVVAEPSGDQHHDPEFRKLMFQDYGDFLSSLNGCYVAAEDVGLTVTDLDQVHRRTRYTTCISQTFGGSGNPSIATGKGVLCAMEGALDFLKLGTLEGKTVAVQGAGNVGIVIIEGLLERGARHVYVTDCQKAPLDEAEARIGLTERVTLRLVERDDDTVLDYPCDVLSPCALGNVLRADTIPRVAARIVCGAANNQLGQDGDDLLLAARGVTYVPDFLANRMGIVNCANETYGRLPRDDAIERHFSRDWDKSVYNMTRRILDKAAVEGVTPCAAATLLADTLSREEHPVWPHRSRSIIRALVAGGWHLGNDVWGSE